MVQINFAQKQINAKIVYYGPGMSGKTTNLEVVHQRAPSTNRGDLTSISTDGDRTLFFDYMPLDLGTIAGMKTCFQMYTVPGQVYYNSTRKLVLQGVDGVIFIADSGPDSMDANIESLRNLEENLNEYGKSLATLPHIIQFNKRDLPDAMTMEEMNEALNPHDTPVIEAVAATGQGVFPTLKGLAALVLRSIQAECSGQPSAANLSRTGFNKRPAGKAPAASAEQPAAAQPAGNGGLELKATSSQPAAPLPATAQAAPSPAPQMAAAAAVPQAASAAAPARRSAPAAPSGAAGRPGGGGPARSGGAGGRPPGSGASAGAQRRPNQNATRPKTGPPTKSGNNLKVVGMIAAAAVVGAAVSFGLLKFF